MFFYAKPIEYKLVFILTDTFSNMIASKTQLGEEP